MWRLAIVKDAHLKSQSLTSESSLEVSTLSAAPEAEGTKAAEDTHVEWALKDSSASSPSAPSLNREV